MRSFKFYTIFLLATLLCTTQLYAKNYLFPAYDGTIGGTAGKLDNIDQCNADGAGYDLQDKDAAIVWDQAGGRFLFYIYDVDSALAESDPDVVAPDYCDEPGAFGAGRWILSSISSSDADITSIAAGVSGLVKGLGDGNGYEAAVDGTDYLSPTLASNIVLNDKYITETETSLTDSDAPSPNLSGGGTYFEFTDDATTDVDSITGFTNFPSDTWVTFRFEDVYWTVDFSQANLYGHGELLWTPRAGDSMICRSHDGTKIECIVSMPTALAISQVYHLPVDSTPDSDDSWAGTTAEFLAGETLAQWDLVYMSHDTGTSEIKKWDADLATYKYYKPIGVVIESGGIADTATGTVGILGGIARNDGWTAFADNADEGKTVYGTTTAGAMSDTAPAVSEDIVCAVGIVLDDDEIMFNFGLCASVEVP